MMAAAEEKQTKRACEGLALISNFEDGQNFISFENREKLSVGRSVHADLKLVHLSDHKGADMISRNHAILQKKMPDNEWVVIDNKSVNGVLVNGDKLVPCEERVLKDCDVVQFGTKTNPKNPSDFVYRYHKKYFQLVNNHAGGDSPGPNIDSNSNVKKRKSSNSFLPYSSDKKARMENVCAISPNKLLREKLAEQELIAKAQIEESQQKLIEVQLKADQDRRSQEASLEQERQVAKKRFAEAEKKLEEMRSLEEQELTAQNKIKEQEKRLADFEKVEEREKLAQEKIREAEQQLAEMKRKLQEKEEAEAIARREMKEKEEKLKKDLEQSRIRLEEEKVQLEVAMKQKLEDELKKKEEQMKERLNREKSELLETRRKIEGDLQREMETKLEEKDKDLQAELLQQKQRLDKVIEKKEIEQKMLECQLNETKAENLKEKENALRIKDDVLSNFADLMETELQCSICSELFIQATSLNCSHSFCAFCIEQWMKKKKECPLCRVKITSHIRSIVLDSYIDTMLEHLSEDMKQNRAAEINFRKNKTQPRKSPRKQNNVTNNNDNIDAAFDATYAAATAAVNAMNSNRPSTSRGPMTTQARTQQIAAPVSNPAPTAALDVVDLDTMPDPPEVIDLDAIPDVEFEVDVESTDPILISDDDNNNDDHPLPSDVSDMSSDDEFHTGDVDDDHPFGSDEEDLYDIRGLRSSPRSRDSDSDSSVEGDPYANYGGYGHCYNCGKRGHWVPGCPFY